MKPGSPMMRPTQTMERLARHPKVIAWGEIGLDYYYDHHPRNTEAGLPRQMDLAAAAKLPIVIHCRPSDGSDNAWEDCLGLIATSLDAKRIRRHSALLHRKLGTSPPRARHGLHDFFSRQLHVPKSPADSRCSARSSAGSDVIETDSPYLAPVPHRGKRNEPAFVKETARKLGESAD